MFCSECNHTLIPISLRGKVREIILDYCNVCGGIWSDQGEVNFIELKDLEPLMKLLPTNPTHAQIQSLKCPKDRTELELFQADSIPMDLTVFRCKNCSGNFFPTNTLTQFKKAQHIKIDYFKTWKIPLSTVYAVLLPLFLVVVLGGGLWATLAGFHENTDVRTQAKDIFTQPVVFSPELGQMMISFTTKIPTTTKIRYWISPHILSEEWVSTSPKLTHSVILKNLEVQRTYSYQVVVIEPKNVESEVYTFSTLTE